MGIKKVVKKQFKIFSRAIKPHYLKKDRLSDWDRFILTPYALFCTRHHITTSKRLKGKGKLDELLKDILPKDVYADRKTRKKIKKDIALSTFLYGADERDYFAFNYPMLSHRARQTFITEVLRRAFYKRVNDQDYIQYLDQKILMQEKFKKYYNRDVVCVGEECDANEVFEFVKNHERFLYKPTKGSEGKGIEILDRENFNSLEELKEEILQKEDGLIEELIVQSKDLAQFHEQSVNSVRLVTFLKPDNTIDVLWCFVRFGMGNNHTDNMGGGGMAAMIDPKTGMVVSKGRDWRRREYLYHPDSGVQLIGFQLPEWDKAIKLANDLSICIPELKVVGWDLCHTKKGWTFIEGNSHPQCVTAQVGKVIGNIKIFNDVEQEIQEVY